MGTEQMPEDEQEEGRSRQMVAELHLLAEGVSPE